MKYILKYFKTFSMFCIEYHQRHHNVKSFIEYHYQKHSPFQGSKFSSSYVLKH